MRLTNDHGARPKALVLSGWLPEARATGSALRLQSVVAAMSRDFDVDLIVLNADPLTAERQAFVLGLGVRDVRMIPGPVAVDRRFVEAEALPKGQARLDILKQLPAPLEMRFATDHLAGVINRMITPGAPDVIHIFRSTLLPIAKSIRESVTARRGRRPFMVVDLDDDETESLDRLALVMAAYEGSAAAEESRLMARLTQRVFERELPEIDVACVCSERDRTRLASRFNGVRFEVLSNVAPACGADRREKRIGPHDEMRVLFVGMLSYAPNIDAVELLTTIIVPEIRRRTSKKVVLDIVGRHPGPGMVERWRAAGAEVHEGPVDLAPFYARADVAVVPIRSAGGTRIKILEAFAHGVPVVSSPMGAEGLEVRHGEHLLMTDTLEDMADACLKLASDAELRETLIRNASELVDRRYGPDRVSAELDRIYAPVKAAAGVGS